MKNKELITVFLHCSDKYVSYGDGYIGLATYDSSESDKVKKFINTIHDLFERIKGGDEDALVILNACILEHYDFDTSSHQYKLTMTDIKSDINTYKIVTLKTKIFY